MGFGKNFLRSPRTTTAMADDGERLWRGYTLEISVSFPMRRRSVTIIGFQATFVGFDCFIQLDKIIYKQEFMSTSLCPSWLKRGFILLRAHLSQLKSAIQAKSNKVIGIAVSDKRSIPFHPRWLARMC